MVTADHQSKRQALIVRLGLLAIAFAAGLIVTRQVLEHRRSRQGPPATQDDLLDLTAVVHDRFAQLDERRAADYRYLRNRVRIIDDEID